MKTKRKHKISLVITIWIAVIMGIACALFAVVSYISISGRVKQQTLGVLHRDVEDVTDSIENMIKLEVAIYVNNYASTFNNTAKMENPDEVSAGLQNVESGTEVSILDSNWVVLASSNKDLIGYDCHDDKVLADVLDTENGKPMQSEMTEVSAGGKRQMLYSAQPFSDGSGYLLFGMAKDRYDSSLIMSGAYTVNYRRVGESGYLLMIDGDDGLVMCSYKNEHAAQSVSESGLNIELGRDYAFEKMQETVFGVPSYVEVNRIEDYYIAGVYPVSESEAFFLSMIGGFLILEIGLFVILFITLIILIRKLIVSNIVRMNNTLLDITDGDLDKRIDIKSTYELDSLSDGINRTVDRLQDFIAEEAARYEEDLSVAESIQSASLPSIFPPFPERDEFDLFASMNAAKEVGGDFYDFFMPDSDTLVFLIADVSGKSIPGAMFMMTAKTTIKDLAESGLPPAEVMRQANNKLFEGNEAQMFVTVWLGYLDLKTGVVRAVNAGHNPPMLIHDDKAEPVMLKPNILMAMFNNPKYVEHTVRLQSGDVLFLYTDGITEAQGDDGEQYGNDRLKAILSTAGMPVEQICDMVTADVNKFTAGAEQFDDMTMLCIRYHGQKQD
ncbi:MAG: SpoIIE family protein phosphatase [Eubacterium sp.]|nr:SpoIIE family protein phosphatase [Eubacterium sp.]